MQATRTHTMYKYYLILTVTSNSLMFHLCLSLLNSCFFLPHKHVHSIYVISIYCIYLYLHHLRATLPWASPFSVCPSLGASRSVPHIDEAVPETVGVVGTMETAPLEVHLPMDMPFDHMKNIYVAIATLAAALLIFIVVVSLKQTINHRLYTLSRCPSSTAE